MQSVDPVQFDNYLAKHPELKISTESGQYIAIDNYCDNSGNVQAIAVRRNPLLPVNVTIVQSWHIPRESPP
jgi:hypothetical protein